MAFVVYVLQSNTTDRLYIGQTNNLERRLREHAVGQTRSTRGRGPWKLIYTRDFPTRAGAVRHERQLKRMKNRERVFEALSER